MAANIPDVLKGAGVVAAGTAGILYSKNKEITPLTAATAVAGAALLYMGFAKKSLPRGSDTHDLNNQTKFDLSSVQWVDEKDADGKTCRVRRGPKGILSLKLAGQPVMDANGLAITQSDNIRTTYDLIFGKSEFDDRHALGYCTCQHTFKDALLKDGRPNPKPTIIDVPGTWAFISYADMKSKARAFGTCLKKVYGIGSKEKVSIWSSNCVEWVLADLACSAYSWTSVSVYDTLGPDAASFIIADSGSKVVCCEEKTFKKMPGLLKDAVYKSNPGKDVQVVVCFGTVDAATKEAIEGYGCKVVSFHDAVKDHEGALEPDVPPAAEDLVTIMYTSGTTGMPKGVMLTHANVTATVSIIDLNPTFKLEANDVHLSYLPMAHIFERQNCLALLSKGAVIHFASNGAKALLPDLSVVRPTLFAGVPKVYENVRDAVKRKMTGVKKTLFDAAFAAKAADLETGCGYSPIWDALIFNKTQKALGGRVRFCVTGGAPISKDTLQFVICALGPVVQGYGATETSSASTVTMNFDLVLGHVGPPLGQVAIRLVDVPDMNYFSGQQEEYTDEKAKAIFDQKKNKSGGEVWIGGPGVSPGYFDPSIHSLKKGTPSNGMAKKTAEDFFTEDGWSWFKTGDIGAWTERGVLKIVDRRKNMFKTSLGEYVPVEEVEKTYQDNCGFADFVFLPKETKVAYVALCVVVSDSIGPVMKWAAGKGVEGDEATVVASPEFKQELFNQFAAIAKEKKLQGFVKILKVDNIYAEYQKPGYQEEWVEGVACANGHTEQLLTATFKARRAQLDQYFAPIFPKLYPNRPADHILP